VIPIARPSIGPEEREAVLAVLDSGQLAQGVQVAEFEKRFAEYLGRRHAVAVSNGTAALHLALLAHGVGRGVEVIIPAVTFFACAATPILCGGRPTFADIDPSFYTMDPSSAAKAVTKKSRVLMPVHLFGQTAEMDPLRELAEERDLVVLEDACQAHGAEYHGRKAGNLGDTACFSFYPTKNMTTGEGGMITTADGDLAEWARLRREHGMKVRYHHEVLGYNFRMTDIHAAIGLAQLDKLPAFNARRIAIAARYTESLRGVVTPWQRPGATHVFHQYTLRVLKRDAFVDRLRERGVGTGVYYPIPVHRQKPFIELGYGDQSFPVSEQLSEEVVSIPVHPGLSDEDVDAVIDAVNAATAELGSHPESRVAA